MNIFKRSFVVAALFVVVGCSSAGQASAPPASQDAPASQATGLQAPDDSPTVQRIRENGKLVGGTGQVLPWTILDSTTNEFHGATVLIAEEIAKRIGVPLELRPVGNDIVVQEVGAGNIDLALFPLYVNPDRLEVIDMVPWHKGGWCYLVLKSNDKLNTLEDLSTPGTRFLGFDGFPWVQELVDKYGFELVSRPQVGNADSGIPDILAGRADVTAIDNPLVYAWLEQYPEFKSIPDPEVCLNEPDQPTPIALGSPKGDAAFTAFLEQLYAEMADDIKAELEKYSDPQYIVLPEG